jgi:Tol biopolymer transport system component
MPLALPFFSTSLVVGALIAAPALAGGTSGITDRVSRYPDGSPMLMTSVNPAISSDGFIVAFETREALLPEDTNGVEDIYVVDRRTGEVRPASRSFQNIFGNGASKRPSISADGRFVAFQTLATNLAGILDQNSAEDVVVKDMLLQTTKLISGKNLSIVAANGASRAVAISANGRFVAFQSLATDMIAGDANGEWDVYVRDLELDTMMIASKGVNGQGNGPSYAPSVSNDGLRVAFHSEATNLTLSADTNAAADIFVHFTDFSACLLISHTGTEADSDSFGVSISEDGSRVAFTSRATNLVPGDNNGVEDVFYSEVFPPEAWPRLVSMAMDGTIGDDVSQNARISGDGRSVVFQSLSGNIAPESVPFTAIFLRDIAKQKTYLVSRPNGDQTLPNDISRTPASSFDATAIAFSSEATNLDQGEVNTVPDTFVRTVFNEPEIYCTAKVTSAGCVPTISYQGLPSASASADSGFVVSVDDVPNQKPGMLFYGLSGKNDKPYFGGTLCVKKVAGRSPVLFSGGTPPPAKDCSGHMEIDMNAFAAGALGGNPHAALSLVGQRVNVQFWGRDPGAFPDPVYLSDALEYVVDF